MTRLRMERRVGDPRDFGRSSKESIIGQRVVTSLLLVVRPFRSPMAIELWSRLISTPPR